MMLFRGTVAWISINGGAEFKDLLSSSGSGIMFTSQELNLGRTEYKRAP
jgi:hypothetical protein